MCPLAPFHVIILYLCMILPLLFAVIEGADELAGLKLPRWNLQFNPDKVDKLKQFNLTEVNITLNCTENCDSIDDPGSLQHLRLVLTNEKENIASLQLKVIWSRPLFLLCFYSFKKSLTFSLNRLGFSCYMSILIFALLIFYFFRFQCIR